MYKDFFTTAKTDVLFLSRYREQLAIYFWRMLSFIFQERIDFVRSWPFVASPLFGFLIDGWLEPTIKRIRYSTLFRYSDLF
jgi:hypothetical protein